MAVAIPAVIVAAVCVFSFVMVQHSLHEAHHTCFEEYDELETSIFISGFQYQIISPSYDHCNKTSSSNDPNSCLRPVFIHFDDKETIKYDVEMHGRNLLRQSAIFKRRPNEEFHFIVVTIINSDQTPYSRKIYWNESTLANERREGTMRTAEWENEGICHKGLACMRTQGNIKFSITDRSWRQGTKIVQCTEGRSCPFYLITCYFG